MLWGTINNLWAFLNRIIGIIQWVLPLSLPFFSPSLWLLLVVCVDPSKISLCSCLPLSLKILGSKWFEEQRVAEVSTRSGKGKHTTRHVSLLPLMGGGYLADTPGYNQPSLIKVTKQSLAQHFPEVSSLALFSFVVFFTYWSWWGRIFSSFHSMLKYLVEFLL